ncbi:MAG: hypothetical protein ACK5ZV_16455 [bacterium]
MARPARWRSAGAAAALAVGALGGLAATPALAANIAAAVPSTQAPAGGTPAARPLARFPQIVSLTWGVGGQGMRADHWSPLVVTLAPGREPFDGVLLAEHIQDSTQRTTVARPVAVAAQPLRVELTLNVPGNLRDMDLTLLDSRGTPVARWSASGHRSGDEVLPFGPINPGSGVVLAASADVEWLSDMGVAALTGVDPSDRLSTGAVRSARLAAADFPTTPQAYDGVDVLVVSGEDALSLEPRQVSAVREWVLSGGRLVVVQGVPGSGWRRWLPPGPAGEVITLDQPLPGAVPAALAKALTAEHTAPPAAKRSDDTADAEEPERLTAAKALASLARAVPVSQVPQRRITLTPVGVARGWRAHWGEAADQAVSATGPVGLGMVTVLGLNPARAAQMINDAAIARAWVETLRTLPVRWEIAAPTNNDVAANWGNWYWRPSVRGTAVGRALAAMAEAPPVTHTMALAIGGVLVLLALLLGPVDLLVLGRLRLRHRSWITASAYITIASTVAWWLPQVLRSGRTTFAAVQVIDAVPQVIGLAPSSAGAASGEAWAAAWPELAYVSEVGTAFAAERLSPALRPIAAGAFVQGTSYAQPDPWGNARLLADLRMLSTPAPLGSSPDAWGGLTASAENPPPACVPIGGRLSMGMWTVRSFLQRARIADAPRVAFTPPDAQGVVSLRIEGLPAGAMLTAGSVGAGGRWGLLDLPQSQTGTDAAPTDVSAPANAAPSPTRWLVPLRATAVTGAASHLRLGFADGQRVQRDEYPTPFRFGTATGLHEPGNDLLDLPGVDRRNPLFAHASDNPSSMVLLLWATLPADPQPSLAVPASGTATRLIMYRLVLPRAPVAGLPQPSPSASRASGPLETSAPQEQR